MRILITGASGFIGGRLARHLSTRGHEIIAGSRNPQSASLPGDVARVAIDLSDTASLDAACAMVDVVVHAAGMNAADCQNDPTLALSVNGAGTGRLAVAARRNGVRRFIYLSTAHVYSAPLVGTISEQTLPQNAHPYATSHLAGERESFQAASGSAMTVVALRLSNAFGAPIHPAVNCWTLLANDLARQWARHGTLTLTSDGRQQRDFTTLRAVCHAIERLIDAQLSSLTCNLGGRTISVLEMAQLIQARAEALSGTRPGLTLGGGAPHPGGNLLYLSGRLLDLVGPMDQNYDAETDQLLQFCQSNFGAGR